MEKDATVMFGSKIGMVRVDARYVIAIEPRDHEDMNAGSRLHLTGGGVIDVETMPTEAYVLLLDARMKCWMQG